MTCDEKNKGAIQAVAKALYKQLYTEFGMLLIPADREIIAITAIQAYNKWRDDNDYYSGH